MKTIVYWSPFLTNVATISAVINSAKSLKLYSKNYKPIIINACGEFTPYKNNLEKDGIELKNLISFDYHKFLPKQGFLKSRISFFIIFFVSFLPLIFYLNKKKPEYFISHLITSLPILISKIISKKTKIIIRVSGLINLNLFRKWLWKYFNDKISIITCPTVSTLDYIKKQNIFHKEKIVLLRDPVINIRKINEQKKNKLNYKIENSDYNIICVGRLTRQKNFQLIINNFEKIIALKPNAKLYILGDGEQKNYLKNLIQDKGFDSKIFLMGFQKNIYNFFFKSDLFILTSLWEDPGWVLIEAASSDVMILSSNCKNGPKEFLENNKGGVLFENNSDEDFLKQFKLTIELSDTQIYEKRVFSKKKSKLYTNFNHYLKLENILK